MLSKHMRLNVLKASVKRREEKLQESKGKELQSLDTTVSCFASHLVLVTTR